MDFSIGLVNQLKMKSTNNMIRLLTLTLIAGTLMMCTPADRSDMKDKTDEAQAEWMQEKQELKNEFQATMDKLEERLRTLRPE